MRKMPKTTKWLENYVENEESEYTTYQYLRYHSSMFATSGNNAALFYGQFRTVHNAHLNVFDSYSRNGYITGFIPDMWRYNTEEIESPFIKGMNRWDHFGGPYTWDPNYDVREDGSLNWFKGPQSSTRHWYYGQGTQTIEIEYLKQFWKAYPENRKFFRTHFSEAHEGTGELVATIDQDITDLLQYFLEMNYLEDTFVTVLSDHGAHGVVLRLPLHPDNSRHLENYYAVLFHFSKNDIPDSAKHFLAENEQAFISSFDIYQTLKSISENSRGRDKNKIAYYQEKIPKEHNWSNGNLFRDWYCYDNLTDYEVAMKNHSLYHTDI